MKNRTVLLFSLQIFVISSAGSYPTEMNFNSSVTSIEITNQDKPKKVTISGEVTDFSHKPVSDAIITVDGIKSSESTNKEGRYKIKVKTTASKIGIYTLPPAVIEELINERSNINFVLNDSIAEQIKQNIKSFSNEDVNTGYSTEKRKSLTTPVGQIDGTKSKYASYNSIYDMLRGEIPGVHVSGTTVLIREPSSVLSSNEPLFVVDGIPVNSIDGISPRNVKTISVLKGSAASIYGSRGANGVIIITTLTAAKNVK